MLMKLRKYINWWVDNMKKKNVMHCFGRLNAGGAETLIVNILRNIDRDRFQFNFIVFNAEPGFYDEEVKKLGCNIFYLQSISQVGIIKYIKKMEIFLKKNKPDIIHSHMDWQGGFIAYAAHKARIKKIVIHSHANQKMYDVNFMYHYLIKLNKFLISKYATECLACSNEAGKSLFKKNFKILPNGIDFNRFQNPSRDKIIKLKKELNIKEQDIVLGNVGSLSKNKNQIFLINILKELLLENDNYKLIIVGNGNMKGELERKSIELGIQKNIVFAGIRSEIPEFMNLFDIFLFPSIHEGLGIAIIEAQVSGTPCMVSLSIPKEADLNVGLLKKLELDEKKWVLSIRKTAIKKIKYSNNLAGNVFNIENTVKILSDIYVL